MKNEELVFALLFNAVMLVLAITVIYFITGEGHSANAFLVLAVIIDIVWAAIITFAD